MFTIEIIIFVCNTHCNNTLYVIIIIKNKWNNSYILWVTLHAVARARTKPNLQVLKWEPGWKETYFCINISLCRPLLLISGETPVMNEEQWCWSHDIARLLGGLSPWAWCSDEERNEACRSSDSTGAAAS